MADSEQAPSPRVDAPPTPRADAETKKLQAMIDAAVKARLSAIESSVGKQLAALAVEVKAKIATGGGGSMGPASPSTPATGESVSNPFKRALAKLEERRKQGLDQPSLVQSTMVETAKMDPLRALVAGAAKPASGKFEASSLDGSSAAKSTQVFSAEAGDSPSSRRGGKIVVDGRDFAEASFMSGNGEDDDPSPGLHAPAPLPLGDDDNAIEKAESVEHGTEESSQHGDGNDDAKPEEDAPPPAANPVPKSGHHADDKARGYSEAHPLMTFADVTFVTQGVISCMLCVMQVHAKSFDFREGGSYHLPMVGYNAFAEFFTMLWVLSRFFLSKRRGEWEIVDDYPGIRSEYFKTWFAYDLIYALPLDFMFAGWEWEIYRWIQLRHFLRLPRMFSLGSSHNPLLSSRLWFRFLSFCFWMFLTAHFLACIFWALENVSYDEAIYWAVATMTSVGYGDVIPTSTNSRIYVCFAMLFGIGMLSTITAFATTFLTQRDKLTEDREAKKQMMYSMLEYYDIPWDVQREVIAAVPAMLENDNELKFKEMSAQLPPFVSKKIDGYIRAKMLRVVPLFKRITDPNALLELSSKLRQQFYPDGEPIIEQGDTDRDMYFLVRGVVEVVVLKPNLAAPGEFDAIVVAVLQAGAFFGEVNLLRGGTRGATVRPMTLCEVLALSQPDFDAFMESHPDIRMLFADQLQERMAQITKQNVDNKVEETAAALVRKKSQMGSFRQGPSDGGQLMKSPEQSRQTSASDEAGRTPSSPKLGSQERVAAAAADEEEGSRRYSASIPSRSLSGGQNRSATSSAPTGRSSSISASPRSGSLGHLPPTAPGRAPTQDDIRRANDANLAGRAKQGGKVRKQRLTRAEAIPDQLDDPGDPGRAQSLAPGRLGSLSHRADALQ